MQPEIKKVSANGIELSYIEQGEGDPVVFVHGSLGDFRSWMFQVGPISKQYHTIAYSRRGHWPGPLIDNGVDYSAAIHALDLEAFIEALRIGPAHIIGHSYGAYPALLMAARRPELVRTLVLAESSLPSWRESIPGGDMVEAEFGKNVRTPSYQAFLHGDLKEGVRIFIDGISGKGALDGLPSPVRTMITDNAPAMVAQAASSDTLAAFTANEAHKIASPALLVMGEMSPKRFSLYMEALGHSLPDSELAVIPGASHFMHIGNPQAFNEIVLRFLARH